MSYTIAEIAREIKVEVRGDQEVELHHVANLETGKKHSLSFATSSQYLPQLKSTRASAVIVSEDLVDYCPVTALISSNPYLSFARAAKLLHPEKPYIPGIHPSAVIHDECQIGQNVHIGPNVVISEKCHIGNNCYIGPGTIISAQVTIGDDCRLIARVSIVGSSIIGQRVIIHPGVVLASDGFGLANNQGKWEKIPQLGKVLIGDDVEIGANSTIDRGALDDTIIEQGVKLDNQIQVAHNVEIGAHTAVAGCVGIAGSAIIGKHCAIGGGAGIQGHIKITDGVQVTGMTKISQSIDQPGIYTSGTAAQDNASWIRNALRFKQLDRLYKSINQILKRLESLEKGK